MTLSTVRRLAADIMNVGRTRIRISPDGLKEAEGALTRADVRNLIEKGIVKKTKILGRAKKQKNKRRGKGSKKGSLGDSKKTWMQKIRSQRKLLAMLVENKTLPKEHKRSIYGKIKSGIFRNKHTLIAYLKDNQYIPKDYEIPQQEKKKPVKKPAKKAAKPKTEEKGEKK